MRLTHFKSTISSKTSGKKCFSTTCIVSVYTNSAQHPSVYNLTQNRDCSLPHTQWSSDDNKIYILLVLNHSAAFDMINHEFFSLPWNMTLASMLNLNCFWSYLSGSYHHRRPEINRNVPGLWCKSKPLYQALYCSFCMQHHLQASLCSPWNVHRWHRTQSLWIAWKYLRLSPFTWKIVSRLSVEECSQVWK